MNSTAKLLGVLVEESHWRPFEPSREAVEATERTVVGKPKIFVFCNGCSPQWHHFAAISEDGHVLARHVCSHHGFAANDMGVNEDGWKRDIYSKRYPDGFEVEYVEVTSMADLAKHAGLVAALKAHVEIEGVAP